MVLAASVIAAFAMAGSADALARKSATRWPGMARGQEFYKMLGIETGMPPDAEAGLLDMMMRLCPALVAMCAGVA